jgi:hypothetical protein
MRKLSTGEPCGENRLHGSEGGESLEGLFSTPIEAKDGFHSLPPCSLDTGNPCRYDAVRAWRKTLANQE